MKGVIGVYSHRHATTKAVNFLYGIQHRGQESSGLTASGRNSIRTWREKGLVSNALQGHFESFIHPEDYAIIGCVSGENSNQEIPPIIIENERYNISVAYDGYLFNKNDQSTKNHLGKKILENIDAHGLREGLANLIKADMLGYYSLVSIILDKVKEKCYLVAIRDPRGVRPLYYGTNGDELYIASESAPFDVLESMGVHLDVRTDFPCGALLVKCEDSIILDQVVEPQPAHCVFEWVYFGRPDSVIEGNTVHMVRKRLGHALVKTHGLKGTYDMDVKAGKDVVVIPVPDSGRSVCIGVAEGLGASADEGVIKNAYLGRTYIIDDPEYRKKASDLKHNIIKATVKGKKVIITDDSIVRGTVSESIAKTLRRAGAEEVDFLVSYAPIFHPCFSDPKDKPLAAKEYEGLTIEEIGERVASKLPSINKVQYNTIENVVGAVLMDPNKICSYCASGVHPFIYEGLKQ
jgi:amidophosphoribosyltransferase